MYSFPVTQPLSLFCICLMLPVGITDQPLFELCAETKSKTEYQVYLQRGVEARTAFMQVPPHKISSSHNKLHASSIILRSYLLASSLGPSHLHAQGWGCLYVQELHVVSVLGTAACVRGFNQWPPPLSVIEDHLHAAEGLMQRYCCWRQIICYYLNVRTYLPCLHTFWCAIPTPYYSLVCLFVFMKDATPKSTQSKAPWPFLHLSHAH